MDSTNLQVRERILSEAGPLFVQRGYDGISMREIAEACALSKAGIYYHFKDKEDLFLALLDSNLNQLTRLLDTACGEPSSTSECIQRFSLAIFTQMDGTQRAMIRLASQEMSKLSPEIRSGFARRYQESFIDRLSGLFREGVRRGELRQMDPMLATWVLLGMLYPFFSQGSEVRPNTPLEAVNAALEIFFHGVSNDQRAG
jgi:AcrR family transcriptional regulator